MHSCVIEYPDTDLSQAIHVTCGPVCLDIGGWGNLPGFVPIDRKFGREACPLAYPDASADVIRASHVLEHFSHRMTEAVLADWVRVLKPDGLLKIAVPDFNAIITAFQEGRQWPIEAYLMGSHSDDNDHHGAIFTEQKLRYLMEQAGLVDIQRWGSELKDCASLPISLNLQGRKPE
jgi:predicted SAM-dependent methyltransferase